MQHNTNLLNSQDIMKNLRTMFLLAFVISCSSVISHGDSMFTYREEFKAFETNPRYRAIFDEDAHSSVKDIQADVENYKELSLFQRMVRFVFFGLEVVVATSETMPKLHGFVEAICKDQAIKAPSIFIAKNRGFFNAAAQKLLVSSGAIVIGQKLLEETSDKELQGVVAHELGHIVHNHVNKGILVSIGSYYGTKWVKQYLFGAPDNNSFDWVAYFLALDVVVPCLINKRFEKEADEFAYRVTNNGEGLIEFFEHLEKKEQAVDNDFDATQAIVRDNYPKIGYADYYWLMARYYKAKVGHNIGKFFSWIYHNTPLGAHPAHADRIKAVKDHLAQQA